MPGRSEFVCETCGRRYAWSPAKAGKKARCKCGEPIRTPYTDPAATASLDAPDASGFELDLPDDMAADASPTGGPGKCVACNAALSAGAVICVKCGTDQRTGKRLPTGVQSLEPGERRKADRAAAIPRWGMRTLQVGMWCNLLGVVLVVMGIPLALGAGISSLAASGGWVERAFEIATAVSSVGGLVLLLLGPILCLAVPGEAKARGVLIAAIALMLLATGLELGEGIFATQQTMSLGGSSYTISQVPAWVGVVGTMLNLASVVCFLIFLQMVAEYLEFPEVTERAEKTVSVYGLFAASVLLSLIPLIGCFAGIAVLIFGIYALWLYLALLVDLNSSLSYRLGEMAE
jgi:uncharacterized membrane protein